MSQSALISILREPNEPLVKRGEIIERGNFFNPAEENPRRIGRDVADHIAKRLLLPDLIYREEFCALPVVRLDESIREESVLRLPVPCIRNQEVAALQHHPELWHNVQDELKSSLSGPNA